MNALNKYFSIDMAIGKEITENEFLVLMAENRLWITRCEFGSKWEAHAAIGGDIDTYDEHSHNVHGGILLTERPNDWEEAISVAKLRGWGETIEGVLCGIIPSDSQMINPYDTSNQTN